jgi:hypothetical protein
MRRDSLDEVQPAGAKSATWQAGNEASGVYFYRLETVRRDGPGRPLTGVGRVVLLK